MDIPDRLIAFQKAADAEHGKLAGLDSDERAAQWQRWFDTAAASQAAVTEHARDTGGSRAELEAAVKRAVRHPEDS